MYRSRLLFGGLLGSCVIFGCADSNAKRLQHAEQKLAEEAEWEKLLARGNAFYRVGDFTRAIQYFSAALEQGAPRDQVVEPLMRSYIESKQYRLAVQFGEEQLRNNPGEYQLRHLVATLLVALNESGRAVTHLEVVLREHADFADAHYALALVYRDHEGDPVKADVHFRRYLELEPAGPHAQEARASLLRTVQ